MIIYYNLFDSVIIFENNTKLTCFQDQYHVIEYVGDVKSITNTITDLSSP